MGQIRFNYANEFIRSLLISLRAEDTESVKTATHYARLHMSKSSIIAIYNQAGLNLTWPLPEDVQQAMDQLISPGFTHCLVCSMYPSMDLAWIIHLSNTYLKTICQRQSMNKTTRFLLKRTHVQQRAVSYRHLCVPISNPPFQPCPWLPAYSLVNYFRASVI